MSDKTSSSSLNSKLKRIRMVVMDVDGVLTDGRIVYDDQGNEYKFFDIHDGYGIQRAVKFGILFAIISGRKSTIVTKRARELGIADVIQGCDDKVAGLNILKTKHQLRDEEICYIGDDELDLPVLRQVGVGAAPTDAMERVRDAVDIVAERKGGRGAVREVVDAILRAKGLA